MLIERNRLRVEWRGLKVNLLVRNTGFVIRRLTLVLTLTIWGAHSDLRAQAPERMDLLPMLDLYNPAFRGYSGQWSRDETSLSLIGPGSMALPFDPQCPYPGQPLEQGMYVLELEVERRGPGVLLLGVPVGTVSDKRTVTIAIDHEDRVTGPYFVDGKTIGTHELSRDHGMALLPLRRPVSVRCQVTPGERRTGQVVLSIGDKEAFRGEVDAERMNGKVGLTPRVKFAPWSELAIGGTGAFRFTRIVSMGRGITMSVRDPSRPLAKDPTTVTNKGGPTGQPKPALMAAEASPSTILKGPWGLTDQIEFSANGKVMVSMAPRTGLNMQNNMVLSVWDMPACRLVVSIPVKRAGTHLTVAADGNSFATIEVDQFGGFTQHACVYSAKTGKVICSIDAGARSLTGIAITSDGSQIAIGTDERKERPIGSIARFGQVALIDVPSKTNRGIFGGTVWENNEVRRPPAVVALSYSPDGQKLAFGYMNNDVSVIDTKTLAIVSTCKSEIRGLLLGHNRIRWSDQETFVVGTDLRRVNARSGESHRLFDPTVVVPDWFSPSNHEPTHRVISTDLVAMSTDRLVIGGSRDRTVPNAAGDMIEKAEFRVLDLKNDTVIRQFATYVAPGHSDRRSGVPHALSPDGKLLAVATGPGAIQMFDVDGLPRDRVAEAGPVLTDDERIKLSSLLPRDTLYTGQGLSGAVRGHPIRLQVLRQHGREFEGWIVLLQKAIEISGTIDLDGNISWSTGNNGVPQDHLAQGKIEGAVITVRFMKKSIRDKLLEVGTARLEGNRE